MVFSMRVICVLATIVAIVYGQCNLQANTDFQGPSSNNVNEGSITTLFGVTSANDCCTACSGFAECQFFSYVSSNSASDYQNCYLKTSVVKAISSSTRTGGFMTRSFSTKLGQSCGAGSATDYNNGFLGNILYNVPNMGACCAACQNYTGCNYYTYASGNKACYLKGNNASPASSSSVQTGTTVTYPSVPARTGKRGLALFDTVSCSDISLYTSISWMYGWNAQPAPEILQCLINLGIEYVPMQWGVNMNIPSMYTRSSHILGFNEPNFGGQANMSPAKAAELWPQIENFAKANNMKTVSPSASAGGDIYDPIQWMTQFLGNCSGCQVDVIATHIYSCYPQGVKGFTDQFKRFGRPLWLTEFACTDGELSSILGRTATAADYAKYVNQTVALLEADPDYERYSYFGTRTSVGSLSPTLSSTRAALNVQGQAYVNYGQSSAPTSAPSTPTSAPATSAPKTPTTTPTTPTSAPVTTAPTTPTTTPTTPSKVYPIYLGCYIDGNTRDLSYQVTSIAGNIMTVELCEAACKVQKYAYAGLQYGGECRCSNSYGSLGKAPASDCSMKCNGNSTEYCGAGWRNSIYQVADAPSKAITDDNGNSAVRGVTSIFAVLCVVLLSMMM